MTTCVVLTRRLSGLACGTTAGDVAASIQSQMTIIAVQILRILQETAVHK